MPIHYIHRPPSILSTPKRLADAITNLQSVQCRARKIIPRTARNILRLYYPNPGYPTFTVSTTNPFLFFSGSKADQRENIRLQEIPTVPCARTHEEAEGLPDYGHGFVVRPLRHSQGRGWRVTQDHGDFTSNREYIQSLVYKRREYRAIICRGELLILLRKRVAELNGLVPWNHTQGSRFITVDPERANLRSTPILETISRSQLVRNIDLVGIDIIQDENNNAFVLEFNSCPSLTIEGNIQKVAEYLVNHEDFR